MERILVDWERAAVSLCLGALCGAGLVGAATAIAVTASAPTHAGLGSFPAVLLGGLPVFIIAFPPALLVYAIGLFSVGAPAWAVLHACRARSWLAATLLGAILNGGAVLLALVLMQAGQRQARCHPALSNEAPILTDYLWSLHGKLILARPPRFAPGPEVGGDPFYRFLEASWMLQQLPVALVLWLLGGWPWVVWGVCVRVAICVTGHWYVGRLAHREGPQTWIVRTSGVQAHDAPWAAIPTMGEAWHNNHHAFPGSAKLGLYPGQSDWGFRFIQLLERLGLAWDVRTPASLPKREGLAPALPPVRSTGRAAVR